VHELQVAVTELQEKRSNCRLKPARSAEPPAHSTPRGEPAGPAGREGSPPGGPRLLFRGLLSRPPGGGLTLLVCSSCHAPLPDGSTDCRRCGPGRLALLVGGDLPAPRRAPDGDGADRLARALGPSYQVIRLIGQGGFAEVYEVTDTDLRRRLAVKVLRSDLPWGPGTLSRFKQEARAIASLSHPNTVPIHFVGEANGLTFYAMPYFEGRSLADVLRADGPLPVPRALAIAEPILETLEHAHQHGLVHRDVKPDNIVIEAGTGRPLLVDFGIVKWVDGPTDHTQAGFVVGTPLYMSPEQAAGQGDVDARTDVYGMGIVLFQMLVGAPPFEGETSQEILIRHLHEPVPVASLDRSRVPRWLSDIIVACLEKHPDDRLPSARAVLDAIRARGLSPVEVARRLGEEGTPARARRWPWRWRPVAAGVALAVLGTAWVAIGARRDPPPEPAREAAPPTPPAPPAPAAVVVENRLTLPIALTMGDTGSTVAPGDSMRMTVGEGRQLEAYWAMVQPSAGGRMLGRQMEGTIASRAIAGELRQVVDARSGDTTRFAPTVVNRTRRPLRVSVVGDQDSTDCRCVVSPGDSVRLGYYLFSLSSAVRVRDDRGATARFDGFGDRTDEVSGAVSITVRPEDLRSR
jgi:Protein kinase domain